MYIHSTSLSTDNHLSTQTHTVCTHIAAQEESLRSLVSTADRDTKGRAGHTGDSGWAPLCLILPKFVDCSFSPYNCSIYFQGCYRTLLLGKYNIHVKVTCKSWPHLRTFGRGHWLRVSQNIRSIKAAVLPLVHILRGGRERCYVQVKRKRTLTLYIGRKGPCCVWLYASYKVHILKGHCDSPDHLLRKDFNSYFLGPMFHVSDCVCS